VSTTPSVAVLLVQPADDGLEMYVEFFRNHGLTPLAVSDAHDAMAVAPEADIIVTGILLPGSATDGAELIVQLRSDERTKQKPIIVVTALAGQAERERCQQAGCDVFLSKPCLPDALLAEMRRLLASRHPQHIALRSLS
jgi:two-component system cell cycle response regulator DivK